jgi:hypothetical protein
MEYVILAVIGIVFLAALVFVFLGIKGWHAGTITAAVLVILSSLGYLVLASMVGERERAWRVKVNQLRAEISKVRDGLIINADGTKTPVGDCSLETLQACSLPELIELDERWSRQKDTIESWRGTWWRNAKFDGPNGNTPMSLTITESQKPAISPGSPLYVFDEKTEEGSGAFLGAFQAISVDNGRIQLQPLAPPDAKDLELWELPHPSVLVLTSLPSDLTLVFQRTDLTSVDPARSEMVPPEADEIPEEIVTEKKLETDIATFTLSDGQQPLLNPEAFELGNTFEALQRAPEAPPGVEWAEVLFGEDISFQWPDDGTITNYRAGEISTAFPKDVLQNLLDKSPTTTFQWVIPPGLYWAEVRFQGAYNYPEGDVQNGINFEVGSTAVLDLALAEKAVADGKAEILRRFYRRPLTDGQTTLLGADSITERVGNDKPSTVFDNLQTLGLYRIRQNLERVLANSAARTTALQNAKGNAERQLELLRTKKQNLSSDQNGWRDDLIAAERIEESVRQRHEQIDAELSGAEQDVIQLGDQLRKMMALVTAEIDRRAPPPDILDVPAAAGAAVQ